MICFKENSFQNNLRSKKSFKFGKSGKFLSDEFEITF